MRGIKRFACAFLCALFICLSFTGYAVTPQNYSVSTPGNLEAGHLYGTAAILMDANTGKVLFEKNAWDRNYPASTTKIMTCLLALEYGPMNEMVTIPNGIEPPSGSSKLGISTGEIMPFNDLVYGMMLASGNDAAIAIAILVSGSEREFVNLMNEKVAEFGLTGTHFVNSHGLHTVNHYTTAYDLAVITRYAMQNETFRDIVKCVTYEMEPTNFHPNGRTLTTKYDPLIVGKQLYFEPCIGVKTGYTEAAGRCFVGAGEKDGQTLITVSLHTDASDTSYSKTFTDTIRLLKYGFLQYTSISFKELCALCDDALLSFKVNNASPNDPNNGYLRLNIADIPETYKEWYLKSDLEDVNYQNELVNSFTRRLTATFDSALEAPISKGDVVGTATFEMANGTVIVGSLVASRDVEKREATMDEILDGWIDANAPWLAKLMPRRNPPVKYLYWGLLFALIALIIWRSRVRKRKEREKLAQIRRQIMRKRAMEQRKRAASAAASAKSGPSAVKRRPGAAMDVTGTVRRASSSAVRASAASKAAPAPARRSSAAAPSARKTASTAKRPPAKKL